MIVAKTDPSAGARGILLIVVETADAQGFTRGPVLEKLGMRGQDTVELFYEHVHLNFDGNYRLARLFAEQVAAQLPAAATNHGQAEWA